MGTLLEAIGIVLEIYFGFGFQIGLLLETALYTYNMVQEGLAVLASKLRSEWFLSLDLKN